MKELKKLIKSPLWAFATLSLLVSCKTQTKVEVQQSANKRPNIIYILADDLGYGDVGFNGQDKILTPNIDQLAAEGMVFSDHYAGSTVCGPSRASLMTGLHTGHSPIRENPRWTKSGTPVDLGPEDVTVAKELKRAGYYCGIIGKWGLAENLNAGVPNQQGFDYFYGFNKHKSAHHYYPDSIWTNNRHEVIPGNNHYKKEGQYCQDLFTEKALDFIEEQKDKPFFLYLSYTIPHYELTINEEEKAMYANQGWPLRKMKPAHYRHDKNGHVTYAAMVTRMDKDIGKVMDMLKVQGVDDNTIVIFTSDNGHEYDNVNNPFFDSNGPFKGHKRDLYEGGVRVPFVARWPGHIQEGTTSSHISAFWDFLPTACDIAGVKPSKEVDGLSYLPTLLGKEGQAEHPYLYWEFNERKGPVQALRMGDWKAVKFLNKEVQLFNLNEDIGEKNNIAAKEPEKSQEMLEVLSSARTEHPEFPLVKKKQKKK